MYIIITSAIYVQRPKSPSDHVSYQCVCDDGCCRPYAPLIGVMNIDILSQISDKVYSLLKSFNYVLHFLSCNFVTVR